MFKDTFTAAKHDRIQQKYKQKYNIQVHIESSSLYQDQNE